MTIKIGVTLSVEGLHNFPIVESMFGEEVSYLKYPHRHNFIIKCEQLVTHTNRDEEFICLKHRIIEFLKQKYYDCVHKLYNFESMSCEMIANELVEHFKLCRCEVSEDGENYAIIEK